ncbi:hypothetical protein [Azospirillum soli]|uniref:hypothetical protein n=1 Tax=Azospirillum soli TaxID=1304799 RepID=UPI001AE217F3|nr:hypothetical protein [Azospirillum soli]MBP2312815.1 hypothetical protein [Azospirillum soli]
MPGRAVQCQVVQRHASFGALRSGKAERTSAGDELVSVQGNEFLLQVADRGVRVKPNGTYNFVRVQGTTRNDAHTFVSSKSGHAGLAGGRPVLYAGTVRFDSGKLDWWSNYSGTYQPIAAFRKQAQLPEDAFVPWQKLQMGGVGLQRGMFNDRRSATAPTKAEPTRVEARGEPAKTESAKREPVKVEAAKAAPAKAEAPKVERATAPVAAKPAGTAPAASAAPPAKGP